MLNKSNQKIDYIFFLNVNKDAIIKRIEKRKVLEKRSDDEESIILKDMIPIWKLQTRVRLLYK